MMFSSKMKKPRRVPNRFLVTKISISKSNDQMDLFLNSAISVNEQVDQYKCILREFWCSSKFNIQVGDFVNIFDANIRDAEQGSQFIAILTVDNSGGLIVVKPDILISTTTLMSASFCMRKAWLSRLFESYGGSCKPFLIGNVVHELFQQSLKQNMLSVDEVENYFKNKLLNSLTLELYGLEMSQSDLTAEIVPYIKSICYWLKLYTDKDAKDTLFSIQRLHEIENSIWSTKYGFIGKVDLSLEVILQDKGNNFRTRNLIPLELKTGRHTFSPQHTGQVILYSFIMAEKYPNLKPTDGFLLYLKDETKTQHVKSNHNVFRDLIILRNNFVHFYDKLTSVNFKPTIQINDLLIKGPEPIDNDRICQKCDHLLDCSLIYKCFDSKQPLNSDFDLSVATTSHLNADDLEFFSKIISLLEIEKQHTLTQDKTIHFWNIRSEDCELSGIGMSKMQLVSQEQNFISFSRCSKNDSLPRKLLTMNADVLVNYSLLEDRRVVISEELITSKKTFEIYGSFCKQLCVAIGTLSNFSNDNHSVEILLEKHQINILNPNTVYRIDFLKNLSNKAMSINFSNILRLMSPDDEKCRELRDIVIRGRFPQHNINTCNVSSLNQIYNSSTLANLNVQQKKAIVGVLRTRCALIFGSPGSGKTQTIVTLLQILVQLGYSVLVTSFTHVAVDNILLKLLKENIDGPKQTDFLRIGQKKRIHPLLKEYADYYRTQGWLQNGDVTSLQTFYTNVPIVASTCLGIFSHPLFEKRKFDFCVLDEASQVYLATCLGPIFQAKNFVLVGDQKQLPPVIKNQYARKQGLEESLFARLLTYADKDNILAGGDAVTDTDSDVYENYAEFLKRKNQIDSVRVFPLFIQYRMNCVIMDLANKLTYSSKLKCANKEIENACLSHYLSNCRNTDNSYLSKAISPILEDSVTFMDTDAIAKAVEIRSFDGITNSNESTKTPGGYVFNDFEAHVVVRLVHTLLAVYQKGGLTASDIGVISPFQRQVVRIRELFGDEFVREKTLEINTVDQYQGRDKEVIIYSCVKSFIEELDSQDTDNSQSSSVSSIIVDSELLKDERRLNVAITRAKKKLIVIGNKRTLQRYEPFKKMFSVLQETQFVQLSKFDCDDVINALEQ